VKKIGLIGHYGWGNIGDEANYLALADLLDQLSYKDVQLGLFSKVSNIKQITSLSDVKPADIQANYDALIFSGGGIFGPGWTTVHSAKNIILETDLPVYFLACGVEILNEYTAEDKALIRQVCARARRISVRDELALRQLQQLAPEAAIKLVPDVVFALRPKPAPVEARGKFNIALCLSPVWQAEAEFKTRMLVVIRAMLEKYEADIFIIPFHFADKNEQAMINWLLNELSAHKENIHYLSGYHSPKAALSILGQMDFVFSLRLHASLMSYSAGASFISVDYHPKIRGFHDLIGEGQRIIPASRPLLDPPLTSDFYGYKFRSQYFNADEIWAAIAGVIKTKTGKKLPEITEKIKTEAGLIFKEIFN